MQWMNVTTSTSSEKNYSFPILFSNQNYALIASRNNIELGSTPIIQIQKTGIGSYKINAKHYQENTFYDRAVSVFAVGF